MAFFGIKVRSGWLSGREADVGPASAGHRRARSPARPQVRSGRVAVADAPFRDAGAKRPNLAAQ